jgi:(R,R)-butanediol dehydrogenase/meso-butanediol dehydrogenase/diacetyl reductase
MSTRPPRPSMRALVFQGPGDMAVSQLPVPPLNDHEVLARVAYCGVCGTDIHIVYGEGGWGIPGSVYGHEWSGEVVGIGPQVRKWRVGDRVVGGDRTCGACEYCTTGRRSLCQNVALPSGPTYGGFAEYVKTHEDELYRVGEGLDLRTAALAEPLAVALHGVTRSGITSPSGMGRAARALVTGAGPIGLLTLAVLRAKGISDVVVSEPSPIRRRRAGQLGGVAVHPAELAAPAHYLATVPDPFDVVLECSGNGPATQQGLGQLRPGGRLVIVGVNFEPCTIDPMRVLVQELEIVGSRQYDNNGLDGALDLLVSGVVPGAEILDDTDTDLVDFLALLSAMRAGEVAGKPLVVSSAIAGGS